MANLLLKRIKDWATSITTFRTGDVIPVDGPDGTAKMSKDALFQIFGKRETTNLMQLLPASLDLVCNDLSTVYENGVLKSDGSIQVVSGFHTTQLIEVDKKIVYQMVIQGVNTAYAQIAMYDSDQNLISTARLDNTTNEVCFIFDAAVKYFKASLSTSKKLKFRNAVDSIYFDKAIDFTYNLFDKTKITNNTYIDSSGEEHSFSGGCSSDYIPVSAGVTYAIAYSFGGTTARTAFYKKDKTFISSEPASASSVTTPAESAWMRISFLTTNKDKVNVTKGTNPIPNEINVPYGSVGFAPRQDFLESAPYIDSSVLEFNVNITFVDGIFEQSSSSSFKTSDFINLCIHGGVDSDIYFLFKSNFAASFSLVRFYDKDYNELGRVAGGTSVRVNVVYKIKPPVNCVYVKFAQQAADITSATAGFGKIKLNTKFSDMVDRNFSPNNNILWIGTSIPQGAEYPVKASAACGYSCINKSLGSSQLIFTGVHPQTVQAWSGRCLTATVAELEALYRQDVTDGVITEATLNTWKDYSYENSIIPYIDGTNTTQVSAIIIDHGFNDRNNIHSLMANPSAIDWSSTDRSNFVGAFNYLYKKILKANPFVKIIIAGYFQNVYANYYSKDVCDMQELVAEKYDLQLMPAWKLSGINFEYVPDSSGYISDFNSTYGTSYTKMDPDSSGNIPLFQFFCPDKVHPHSDLTGNSNSRLNAVYTKLLKSSL